MQNFACFGRKTKKNPKKKDGKIPPQAPQPHLHPEISSYIRYALTRRLWSQLIGCFHVFSSYTHVRVKKPLNNPVLVGLIQQYIVLNPTRTGGGPTGPHMQNFACFGRKTKKNPKRKVLVSNVVNLLALLLAIHS